MKNVLSQGFAKLSNVDGETVLPVVQFPQKDIFMFKWRSPLMANYDRNKGGRRSDVIIDQQSLHGEEVRVEGSTKHLPLTVETAVHFPFPTVSQRLLFFFF